MSDRPLFEDRDIGGASANIYKCNADFLFLIVQHSVAGGERFEHNVANAEPSPLHAIVDVLNRCDQPVNNMHARLEAHAGHTDRLEDAVLTIDDILLWNH